MAQRNEIVRANFAKVVEWIRATFPHAIEASYDRKIECNSVHHVYHTSYLVIDKGVVYHHRGSHGWSENDTIYNSEDGRLYENSCRGLRDVTEHRNDIGIEEFLHEWPEQKLRIQMTLQPYENMYDFKV